jgi:hypothetical protein
MYKKFPLYLSLILIFTLCSPAYGDFKAFRKYPYLIHGGYKAIDGIKKPSMIILWHTSQDPTATIEFGTTRDAGGNPEYGSPITVQGKDCCQREGKPSGCTCSEPITGYLFQYTKEGLTPGSVIYYRVKLSTGETFYSRFSAAPDEASKNLVFYGLGDTRTDRNEDPSHYEAVVAQLWKDIKEDRSVRNTLCLHDGDFVMDGQNREGQTKGKDNSRDLWDSTFFNPDQWTGYRQDVVQFLSSMPLMAVAGNHEGYFYNKKVSVQTDYLAFGQRFKAYFPYPFYQEFSPTRSQNCASGKCFYYSFDYGPAHFIMVDVNQRDKQAPNAEAGDNVNYASLAPNQQTPGQYEWLKNDIKNSTKKWNILVLHNPLYTATGLRDRFKGGGAAIRDGLHNLLANDPEIKGKVRLVIQGHDHYYARAEKDGITYLTLGTAGANSGGRATCINPNCNPPPSPSNEIKAAFDNNCGAGGNIPCFHFARFEITDNMMKMTVIYATQAATGNVEPPFTIDLAQ